MTNTTTNITYAENTTPAVIIERNMKRMAISSPNLVKHFIRSTARLYGKLALREQFNLELTTGFTSYKMVELDHEELCREIIKDAKITAKSLCRLNTLSLQRGYGPVLRRVEELSLTEIIQASADYLEELVAKSDYGDWGIEISNYVRPCDK